jgi:predicted permease
MEGIEPNWDNIYAEGRAESTGKTPPLRMFKNVSPDFFRTAGTKIIAGRELTWTEVDDLRPVALVSGNLARELWGTPSAAIGKRIREFSRWWQVIGVVEDVRENGVHEQAPAIVYWPSMMNDLYGPGALDTVRTVTFAIRSDRAGTESFLNELRHSVWSVNGSLPLAAVRTMQEVYDLSLARTSFTLAMLAIAGAMALVLGVIGIYGVMSYSVSQRRREIGIRLALGAQARELRRMFVRSGLAMTGLGVGIGLAAAVALMRLMKSLLFGISPFDPLTYVVVPIILTAAAVLASYVPARRAAAVNPVEALRVE